jgi:hypothetical protein
MDEDDLVTRWKKAGKENRVRLVMMLIRRYGAMLKYWIGEYDERRKENGIK